MNQEALTLTVDQTAELLGISRGLAYEAVKDGTIPSVRLGRRILVPRDGLLRMLGADPPVRVSAPPGEGEAESVNPSAVQEYHDE